MMAPLPHDQQRPGAVGTGLTDLLGIAPGASYRLVVPGTAGGAISDVDAAFLAAANQTPRPDVITASLGFGLDQDGFSTRYLEDDPLTEAILASIVHGYDIVVCVSSGDGLRTFTNAAVPPSGGAVATDLPDMARRRPTSTTSRSPARCRAWRTPARSTSADRRSTTSSLLRRGTRATRRSPRSTRSRRSGTTARAITPAASATASTCRRPVTTC